MRLRNGMKAKDRDMDWNEWKVERPVRNLVLVKYFRFFSDDFVALVMLRSLGFHIFVSIFVKQKFTKNRKHRIFSHWARSAAFTKP